jgi:hypothetical protein
LPECERTTPGHDEVRVGWAIIPTMRYRTGTVGRQYSRHN